MSSLVSVVVPTYNHAHFLGRALQSVIDQTYTGWEVLVVDNHSEDDTDGVIARFADSRIRLLKIHNHGAIAASRNLGMCEARGEWLAFLDSDDCWYPHKLENVMARVERGDESDVYSNDELMVDVTTGATRRLRYGPYAPNFYERLLVEGNRLSTSATVVRRQFVLEHGLAFDESPEHISVEDYGFWLDLARAGARFSFLDDVQGEYTIHGGNNSGRVAMHLKNNETLLRHHVFHLQQFQQARDQLWRRVLPRVRYMQIRELAAARRYSEAARLAMKTFWHAPSGSAQYVLAGLKRAVSSARD